MQDREAAAVGPPTETNRAYSRESLLLRYARGRVARFASRQFLTLVGSAILALNAGLALGLLAMAIALIGEVVDCLLLRSFPLRLARGQRVAFLIRFSTLTAVFQALCVAICILLSWHVSADEAPLFALSFLAGAAISGALVLPYHRPAAVARLVVYGLTLAVLLAYIIMDGRHTPEVNLLNAAGTLVLAYIVFQFLGFVLKGTQRNRGNLLALADQRRILEETNAILRQSQREAEQLSLVARNANDSVIVMDADGRIVWVNDAFTNITGFSSAEAVGRQMGQLLNGPETAPETVAALQQASAAGVAFRGVIRSRTRSGSYVWLETNQVPVLDASGRPEMTVSIERDVTATLQAERAKAEFLANMSHEIRTPMNGVIGMADLLCDTRLDREQKTYADAIRSSAQSLLALINDILDLSKLDAGKMKLVPVDFDLRGCLSDTVLLLGAQAEAKQIGLRFECDPGAPVTVRGDDARLRQVLLNLVGNAIKFTEAGQVTLSLSADPDAGPFGIRIDVRDTGIGIAQEHIEKIFERFSQAESTTTRRFGGTGLGLTISRMLVEEMGGRIWVTSRLGEGACFSLCLPLSSPMGEETRPVQEAPAAGHVADLAGKRVLLVEDNRVNRLLVQKYLCDTSVELIFADNGLEAIQMIRTESPDLVLMDMSMPVMGGIEATERIRKEKGPQPPILALTANAFDSDRAACIEAGMDGYLTKPIRRSELLAAMIRHLSAGGMRAAG